MSFGWSAGDIAFTISLLISAAKALDDINGSASEFRDTVQFLHGLTRSLQPLEVFASKDQDCCCQDEVVNLISLIKKPVEEFLALIQKFMKSLGDGTAKGAHRHVARKLQWKYQYSDDAKKLQQQVERHLLVLNPLLHRLTLEAIGASQERVSQQLREDIMDLLDSSLERAIQSRSPSPIPAALRDVPDIKAEGTEPKSPLDPEPRSQMQIEPKSLLSVEPKSRDIEKRVVMTLNAVSRQAAPPPATQVIRTPDGDPEHHLQAMYAQIDHICAELPNPIVRYGVRTELERAAGRLMSDLQSDTSSSSGINTPTSSVQEYQSWHHAGKKRRRLLARTSTKLSTVLGVFHCTIREYECFPSSTPGGDLVRTTRELESSFQLVPSWWLVKCRLSNSIGAQVVKSTEGALTFTLQTFNVIADDSLIFDFAKQGNLDGIRTLLTKGYASVNDMDSLGRTPLHFAADSCQPQACQLLLEQGADMMKKDLDTWDFSPFKRACYPSSTHETKLQASREGENPDCDEVDEVFPPHVIKNRIDTMRVFVSAGLDIEEEVEDQSMRVAGFYERMLVERGIEFESATFWMLRQFISSAKQNTYLYDSEWWGHKLFEALNSDPGGPTMEEMVKHCDQKVIQQTLLIWVGAFNYPDVCEDMKGCVKAMRLILDRIPSLHFIDEKHDYDRVKGTTFVVYTTPTAVAMERSRSLRCFLSILRSLGIDTQEHIHQEIKLEADGWTEETMAALFEHEYIPTYDKHPSSWCKICRCSSHITWWEEPLWDQRRNRIKAGEDPDGPFSEDELKVQKEWDRFVYGIVHDKMCQDCQIRARKQAEDGEFSPFLLHT